MTNARSGGSGSVAKRCTDGTGLILARQASAATICPSTKIARHKMGLKTLTR